MGRVSRRPNEPMDTGLTGGPDHDFPASPILPEQRTLTVRMPSAMHGRIRRAAAHLTAERDERVSMNRFCLAAIDVALATCEAAE